MASRKPTTPTTTPETATPNGDTAPTVPEETAQQANRSRGTAENLVILIGRLTANPELHFTNDGRAVCNLRLVTNETSVGNFHDLVAFGQPAEFAAEYLRKGRLLYVQGRLQSRMWTDQHGQRRRNVQVLVNRLQPLDSRPRDEAEPVAEVEAPNGEPEPAVEPATVG